MYSASYYREVYSVLSRQDAQGAVRSDGDGIPCGEGYIPKSKKCRLGENKVSTRKPRSSVMSGVVPVVAGALTGAALAGSTLIAGTAIAASAMNRRKQPGLASDYDDWDWDDEDEDYIEPPIVMPDVPEMPPSTTPAEAELSKADQEIRYLPFERAVVVDPATGKRLLIVTGDENSVRFYGDQLKLIRGKAVTHNHPAEGFHYIDGDARRAGLSFSLGDLTFACAYRLKELRAVGQRYVHILRPPPGGWETLSTADLAKAYTILDHENYQEVLGEILRGEVHHTVGELEARHKTLEDIAHLTGIFYKRYQHGDRMDSEARLDRKAVRCGPSSRQCGNACVPRTKKCRTTAAMSRPMTSEASMQAQATIAREEAKIRNQPIEHGIIIDPVTGEKLAHRTGTATTVSFPPQEMGYLKGRIITHNHPNFGKWKEPDPRAQGFSFSDTDIRTACYYEVKEVRAVSKGYTHSMQPPKGGWNKDYYDRQVAPAYNRNSQKVYNEMVNDIYAGKITPEQAEVEYHNEVWKRTARDTGMTYTRTPVKQKKDSIQLDADGKPCGRGYISAEKECRIGGAISAASPGKLFDKNKVKKKGSPAYIAGAVGVLAVGAGVTAAAIHYSKARKEIDAPLPPPPENRAQAELDRADQEIRDLKNEHSVVVDPVTGERLFIVQGNEDSIQYNNEEYDDLYGKMMTHNHPVSPDVVRLKNGVGVDGNTFSVADIRLAIDRNAPEIRAVGGKFLYVLKPPASGWSSVSKDGVTQLVERYERQFQQEVVKEILLGKLDWRLGDLEMAHRVLKQVSQDTGMFYERYRHPASKGDSSDWHEDGQGKPCGRGYISAEKKCRNVTSMASPGAEDVDEDQVSETEERPSPKRSLAYAAGAIGVIALAGAAGVGAAAALGATANSASKQPNRGKTTSKQVPPPDPQLPPSPENSEPGSVPSPRATGPTEPVMPAPATPAEEALDRADREIRDMPVERLIGVDPESGERIAVIDGDERSVRLDDSSVAILKGKSITHNHPGILFGDGDVRQDGATFSQKDVELAVSLELAELRAVGRRYTYVLKPPAVGWKSISENYIKREHARYTLQFVQELREKIARKEITPGLAEFELDHRVWEQIAKDTGMQYKRYVQRDRLDSLEVEVSSLRVDGTGKPCGRGYISSQKQCHSGSALATPKQSQRSRTEKTSEAPASKPANKRKKAKLNSYQKAVVNAQIAWGGLVVAAALTGITLSIAGIASRSKEHKERLKDFQRAADERDRRFEEMKKNYEQRRKEYQEAARAAGVNGDVGGDDWYQNWKRKQEGESQQKQQRSTSTGNASSGGNWWDVLGVDRDASADEIKSAYRKLARKFHPDLNKEPGAEQKMQDINAAFELFENQRNRDSLFYLENVIQTVIGYRVDSVLSFHQSDDLFIRGRFRDNHRLYDFEISPSNHFGYSESDRKDSYLIGFYLDAGLLKDQRGDDRSDSGIKKCEEGKLCGETCIPKGSTCRIALSGVAIKEVGKVRKAIKDLPAKIKPGDKVKKQGKGVNPGAIAIVAGAAVLGVPAVTYAGMVARYRGNLDRSVEKAKKEANTFDVHDPVKAGLEVSPPAAAKGQKGISLKKDAEQVTFVVNGFSGTGGSAGDYFAGQLARTFKTHHVVGVENPEFDTEPVAEPEKEIKPGSAQEFMRDVQINAGRIKPMLETVLQRGENPVAIRMAARAYAYNQKHPDKPINLVGVSAGGMVTVEAAEILKRMGVKDVRVVNAGAPYYGIVPQPEKTINLMSDNDIARDAPGFNTPNQVKVNSVKGHTSYFVHEEPRFEYNPVIKQMIPVGVKRTTNTEVMDVMKKFFNRSSTQKTKRDSAYDLGFQAFLNSRSPMPVR